MELGGGGGGTAALSQSLMGKRGGVGPQPRESSLLWRNPPKEHLLPFEHPEPLSIMWTEHLCPHKVHMLKP